MSNLNDNLKKTIDDLDLDRRLEQLSQFAQKTVADVKAQAGSLAHDNRDKVDEWVSKATAKLDERTDGKYHDKAVKFGAALGSAVDKVADQRPAGSASPAADYQPSPTATAAPFPSHPYGAPDAGAPQAGAAETPADAGASVPTGWPDAEVVDEAAEKAWYDK
ncbi:hypothetical protein [Nostocoides jenkinsii]|uniref:Antitoxin n=1 Tax=Nostocoides jenkinsii Ben 74 TaxID=1193518 RepID=A0A077M7B1_9MICO|nr:hypothetical protein [Tetrasphaera jenkinsii]CCI51695.1 hypothetical protein BN13_1160003 [Tetrasphaera jenkinsii Ben 74]